MNYKSHLQKDSKLGAAIAAQPAFVLSIQEDLFSYLCASIIGQQLSVKVAAIIRDRFFMLFHTREELAIQILKKDLDALKSVGLSNSKAQYIKNIATFYLEQKNNWELLHSMTDDEIIEFLTQIKGVGKWTVEMLLMFAMGREDVFPDDDLGIQQSLVRLYNIKSDSKKDLKRKMQRISAKWSPYRTYACLHLWKWKDN